MDPASFVGIGLALFALFVSMIMDGGNPAALLAPSSLLLTFGGTIGAATAGMLLSDAKSLPKILKIALTAKVTPPDASVGIVVAFAEKARRQGLLALEEEARQIDDTFLRKGIEMAVDGADPEEIRDILDQDIEAMKSRHRAGAKFFADMGGFAPTMGIIGTVMGLLHVLQNLSTPATLGPMIAAAFTATLWGVMQANVFWLPISNRLKRTSEIEVRRMDLLLEGIIAIQAGANPRVVEQRLLSYLSPQEQEAARNAKDAQAAAAKAKAA
ncbi:MAG TPA: flagellar motor protein [Acidimicrobiales bacterium]|nr:flagellar motor protein [Acidimicrobiales bacterium]